MDPLSAARLTKITFKKKKRLPDLDMKQAEKYRNLVFPSHFLGFSHFLSTHQNLGYLSLEYQLMSHYNLENLSEWTWMQ